MSRGVAVVVGAALHRSGPVTVTGSSRLARALSRQARPYPHHRLGTDGDALLERACEIAADDDDARQDAILGMFLDTMYGKQSRPASR